MNVPNIIKNVGETLWNCVPKPELKDVTQKIFNNASGGAINKMFPENTETSEDKHTSQPE